jgi:DNA-binding response OmpR family regulator
MRILLVEDNPSEARLTREALVDTGYPHELDVVSDGEKATEYLQDRIQSSNDLLPGLILLDLNLPGKNGREVLRDIKADHSLSCIPVIVISTSNSADDINEVYRLKGNCYLVKPPDLNGLFALMRSLADFWLRRAFLPSTAPGQ